MDHFNPNALRHKNIVFIGGGNMASAIIDGLLSANDKHQLGLTLGVSDKHPTKLDAFAKKGVRTTIADDARALIQMADVIILAIKPQVASEVLPALSADVANKLILSVMAGIPVARLSTWLNTHHVIRCMPNLPASIGYGATGLFAPTHLTQADKDTAFAIMSCVGISAWVAQEEHLHAITAVSGSSPAYFFYALEAMIAQAVSMGLDPDTAKQMACMSLIGAGQLALASDDISALRVQVTSKGGTTEQALNTLQNHHFQQALSEAMMACTKRSVELGNLFNQPD